jgi:ankyrin repeat protein
LKVYSIHYDTITLAYYSSKMVYANLLRAAIRKNSKALSVRFGYRSLTLLHVVIEEIKKNNKIAPSIMEERIQVITTLIECGLDVDGQCGDKRTALHYASELDDDLIVKFLLEQGANINLTDKNGQNALHIALQNSEVNMRIIKLLIDKGIDVETKDKLGRTPLHFCCSKGHYDALIMLLNHDLPAKIALKRTETYYIAISRQRKPNKNVMSSLISKGVDVNVKDFRGRTPLHYTCC